MSRTEEPSAYWSPRMSQIREEEEAVVSASPRSKRTPRARSRTAADIEDASAEGIRTSKRGRKKDGEAMGRTKIAKASTGSIGSIEHDGLEESPRTSAPRSRELDIGTPKRTRPRSKSSATGDANAVPHEPVKVFSDNMIPKSKEPAESEVVIAAAPDSLRGGGGLPAVIPSEGPPPPATLPPPPVFYISSPPVSPRHRPLAASGLESSDNFDTDLTSSTSTIGGGFSSPIPAARRAGALKEWTQQMESELVDVEIRLRQKKVEEEELDLILVWKRRQVHDLDLEIQRRKNELEQLRVASIAQLAVNNDLAPPTLSTPGSRALGPTTSAVWRGLESHVRSIPLDGDDSSSSSVTTTPQKSPRPTKTTPVVTTIDAGTVRIHATSLVSKPTEPMDSKSSTDVRKDSKSEPKDASSSSRKSSKKASSLSPKSSIKSNSKHSDSNPTKESVPAMKESSSRSKIKVSTKLSDSPNSVKSNGVSSNKSSPSGNSTSSSVSKRQHSSKSPPSPAPSSPTTKHSSPRRRKDVSDSPKVSKSKSPRNHTSGIDAPPSKSSPTTTSKKGIHSQRRSSTERSHPPSPPGELVHPEIDIAL